MFITNKIKNINNNNFILPSKYVNLLDEFINNKEVLDNIVFVI